MAKIETLQIAFVVALAMIYLLSFAGIVIFSGVEVFRLFRSMFFLVAIAVSATPCSVQGQTQVVPSTLSVTTFICPFKFGTALVETAQGNESIFINNRFSGFAVGSGFWTASTNKDDVILAIQRFDGDTMRANIGFSWNGQQQVDDTQMCRRNRRNVGLQLSCQPNSIAARLLQSASPNDIHPTWGGSSRIGLDWRVEGLRAVNRDGVAYLSGDLISPRGGVINHDVTIIAAEWTCQ